MNALQANASPQLSEQLSAGSASIRIDVHGGEPRDRVMEDMNFLNYRLADVRLASGVTLERPDIVWHVNGAKSVSYDGHAITFTGAWPAGPLQKAAVAMLALRMEAVGMHPFHASAVRYGDETIMFLGGESNHGKSMGQIEACRRGGRLVSTETTVTDESGTVLMGSKDVFIKKRAEGTERADKAAPNRGVEKFFGEMPSFDIHEQSSNVDVVVVPSIDGNYDASLAEMIPFERQFQTFHSLQNYFLLNELLAPDWPMPLIDTEELRKSRARFVASFAERPYYFVRAANPQVLMDEVDKVL